LTIRNTWIIFYHSGEAFATERIDQPVLRFAVAPNGGGRDVRGPVIVSVKVLLAACLAAFVTVAIALGVTEVSRTQVPTASTPSATMPADHRAVAVVHGDDGSGTGRSVSIDASSRAGTYDVRVDLMGVEPTANIASGGAK
jgi:hypothetical protein